MTSFPPQNPADSSEYLEPYKLADVWFSGDSVQLAPFLRDIRNFLHHRKRFFASEDRVIIWVSLHFGHRPSENIRAHSQSQNWFNSLIRENARLHGKLTPYADFERLAFVLPALASWDVFEEGLIKFFGDKYHMDTAKAALNACRQGSMSVEDYNTQFSSLVYLVDMGDGDRIDRYIKGLNVGVRKRITGPAWRNAATLEERMQIAVEGAKDLEELSKISDLNTSHPKPKPPPQQHVPVYHHPHSTQRAPDSMDIDAATAYSQHRVPNPFEILFRKVCLAQRCCFRCLKRTAPPDHTGPRDCPNGRTSLADKEKFVERYRLAPPVSVAAASLLSPLSNELASTPDVNSQPIPVPSPTPAYGFDEDYDDLIDADLATVQVRLDTSCAGRIVVLVAFQVSPSKSVVASVLVDTGAMANFISKKFIDDNLLRTRLRKNPIRCVGFDGNEGVGGLVTDDWVGRIHISSVDATSSVPFPSSFGVTCLGSVDAIFGLPWLDRQTWTASGSSAGGHCFILGSTEIFVVDAFSLGEELEAL
ncbi:hypothetical protein Pst134EB_018411 [Puccinia striiformis f. sp. tritici]|nr:hypothetical protein Pst134EB_018411 [Puccinia striiformis f. sp. tritici]